LLRLVEEFQKYVLIAGLKVNRVNVPEELLRIINTEKLSNTEIQIFAADCIATWQHLYFAVLNALMAFKNKANVSRSLAMETMLYASAQRQIRRATEILGVRPGSSGIAMLVIGEMAEDLKLTLSKVLKRVGAETDEAVLDLTDAKVARIQRIFNISDEELGTVTRGCETKKALVDLVIERMAILATER
jgi:KEOPS complex subunit Cgi121